MRRYHILWVGRSRSLEAKTLPALRQHYEVSVAHGRREAVDICVAQETHLTLIDVPTIRFDLEHFCADLKTQNPSLLLFFFLGRGMRLDQLPRANGHLRQAFTLRQLLGRLARLLPERGGEVIAWQGLQLHLDAHSLSWGTEEILMTPRQGVLAKAFLEAPEQVLSRALLMQEVWGTSYLGDTRTLDVHIHWLRSALLTLKAPFQVRTHRGVGYALVSLLPSS
ncbi:MAG: response regulator transcription factor [Anaerolineae bacterium]|nr:response regulator transcription factor [Anaerolineae bacterium]